MNQGSNLWLFVFGVFVCVVGWKLDLSYRSYMRESLWGLGTVGA